MTMLDRMRRHRNWLKWSLALVVLTFIAFYIPSFLDTTSTSVGASASDVVATVNGKDIRGLDFQRRYQSQIQAYQQQYGGSINEQLLRQLGVDQQILQQMVDEQAALAEAERQGIRVSDEELAQQIFSIPALQENGRFIGEQRYEQLLASQQPPMTKGDFEENLRRSMMIEKLRSALTDWMALADADVEREYKNRNEKVKLQVVALTADKFRDKVNVSDADVSRIYGAHTAEYRKGEQRKIRYLLIDRDQMRSRVTITPQDIESYYNSNVQQFQTPEQVRASHILLKTEGKDEAAGTQAGRRHPEAGESARRGLRGPGQEIFGRRWVEGQRRRPRLLPQGPDGPRVRGRGVRDAARTDQRSREVAVRLSHHQGRGQEAREHAHARRGARANPGDAGRAARRAANHDSHARPRYAHLEAGRPRYGRQGSRRRRERIGILHAR